MASALFISIEEYWSNPTLFFYLNPGRFQEVCTPTLFNNHASIMKPQILSNRAVSDIVRVTFRFCTFKCEIHIFLKKTNN